MLKTQVEDIRGRLLEAKLQNVRLKNELQSRKEALEGSLVVRPARARPAPAPRPSVSERFLQMLPRAGPLRSVLEVLRQDRPELQERVQGAVRRRLERPASLSHTRCTRHTTPARRGSAPRTAHSGTA